MIRVALLGSDSTHAEAFASRINDLGGRYRDSARVVAIWGEDPDQARDKAASLGIARVAATVAEALEGVDLAMVIGRFADSHYVPAKKAMEQGVTTFVDKPFAESFQRAEALAALARESGTPLCSGSPLRFSPELAELRRALRESGETWKSIVATAPAACTDLGPDPRLNSAFFYGIHGLEMLLDLAGHDVVSFDIHYGKTAITAHIEIAGAGTAIFQLVRDTIEFYSLDLYTATGYRRADVTLDGGYYDAMVRFLLEEFQPGRSTIPIESTLQAISILEQVDGNDPDREKMGS